MTRKHIVAIAVILLNLSVASSNEESELALVHVIFRHGERTPYEFYPTDPYRNETFYPIGPGGLTNRGKLIEYTLGSNLREQYGSFLGDVYTNDVIHTSSTDSTRTKMSALLVLAGLWPPNKLQQWHPTILWQPIPVSVKPDFSEDIFPGKCKSRDRLISNLYQDPVVYQKFIEPHLDTMKYIEEHSGLVLKDILEIQPLYLALKTESDLGLKLPEWTGRIFPETLQSIIPMVYAYYNYNLVAKQVNSGYMLQKILNDSLSKINNNLEPKDRKMFLYSGHESTLGYFLNALNLSKPRIPSYGSAIMVEIHKGVNNQWIKIKYVDNPLNPVIENLNIPNCDDPCSLQNFMKLNNDILPTKNRDELCDINTIL